MFDEYTSESCSSECFFEYKVDQVSGSSDIAPPKIYFERDYKEDSLPYTLFAVPQEWLGGVNNFNLPYDSIKLIYDVSGLECAPLTNENSPEYRNAEIRDPLAARSVDDFYRAGCRIPITNSSKSSTLSGVGVMDMYKDSELVARFFIIVNFAFKTKIHYTLSFRSSKLNINFECKARPKNVRVRVVWNESRLPCLKNDMGNVVDEFVIDFSKETFNYTKNLGSRYSENSVFSLMIYDEISSRYYILHCDRNDTVKMTKNKVRYRDIIYTCPFCHKKMDNRILDHAKYKRGGISCSYYTERGQLPAVFDQNGHKMKNCLFCSSDTSNTNTFDSNFMRVLPKNFMQHDSFKIAFLGSARAGKTTYISRFFNLTGDNINATNAHMDMEMIQHSLKKIGVDVKAASIVNLFPGNSVGEYNVDGNSWISMCPTGYYGDRTINLDPPHYPGRTTTDVDSYGRYPFMAEVNNDAYISFYDVAGEDSQDKQMIAKIAGGDDEYIGVFCIVSGTRNAAGNSAVLNQLRQAKIHKDSPIAVIVTKFDTLKDSFDQSCHCMRTDYFDDSKVYTDSYLQHEIDCSSEEVCSYLKNEGLYQDLSSEFKNVKYFAVSSFNFKESIHRDGEKLDDPGQLKFECSASRLELPFIWMLNQFGIIK